jgi:hypothetical protein
VLGARPLGRRGVWRRVQAAAPGPEMENGREDCRVAERRGADGRRGRGQARGRARVESRPLYASACWANSSFWAIKANYLKTFGPKRRGLPVLTFL